MAARKAASSRRHRQTRPLPPSAGETQPVGLDPAARVAWSYLATLVASMAAGLALVLASPVVTAVCASASDALCDVEFMLVVAAVVYLSALAVAARAMRLGWWYWVAQQVGLFLVLVISDHSWIAAAVVAGAVPALAALMSHPWKGDRLPRWQRIALVVAAIGAIASTVWIVVT